MTSLQFQHLILLFAISLLSGCVTRPIHLYDVDEVYRISRKTVVDAVYWDGTNWLEAGSIEIPVGTYFMGRID